MFVPTGWPSCGFGIGLAGVISTVRSAAADNPPPMLLGLLMQPAGVAQAPLVGPATARVWDPRVIPTSASQDPGFGASESSLTVNNAYAGPAAPSDEWPGARALPKPLAAQPTPASVASSYQFGPIYATRPVSSAAGGVRQASATTPSRPLPCNKRPPTPPESSVSSQPIVTGEILGSAEHHGFMAFLAPPGAPEESPSSGQPYVDPFELHKPARPGGEADGGEGGGAFAAGIAAVAAGAAASTTCSSLPVSATIGPSKP